MPYYNWLTGWLAGSLAGSLATGKSYGLDAESRWPRRAGQVGMVSDIEGIRSFYLHSLRHRLCRVVSWLVVVIVVVVARARARALLVLAPFPLVSLGLEMKGQKSNAPLVGWLANWSCWLTSPRANFIAFSLDTSDANQIEATITPKRL